MKPKGYSPNRGEPLIVSLPGGLSNREDNNGGAPGPKISGAQLRYHGHVLGTRCYYIHIEMEMKLCSAQDANTYTNKPPTDENIEYIISYIVASRSLPETPRHRHVPLDPGLVTHFHS